MDHKLTDAQKVYIGVFVPTLVLIIILIGIILYVVFRNKISFRRSRLYAQSKEIEIDNSIELPN